MYSVNAAETHETFRQESGMQYHLATLTESQVSEPCAVPLHHALSS